MAMPAGSGFATDINNFKGARMRKVPGPTERVSVTDNYKGARIVKRGVSAHHYARPKKMGRDRDERNSQAVFYNY